MIKVNRESASFGRCKQVSSESRWEGLMGDALISKIAKRQWPYRGGL